MSKKGVDKTEPVVETLVAETPPAVEPGMVADSPVLAAEPTESPVVARTPDAASVEATTTDAGATTPDAGTPAEVPTTTDEHTPTKQPRKLKVKADASPKKLSMMAAALQALRDRKVAMTCPELFDVMATEDMWTSPGGMTPANTLYAAISRGIGREASCRRSGRRSGGSSRQFSSGELRKRPRLGGWGWVITKELSANTWRCGGEK